MSDTQTQVVLVEGLRTPFTKAGKELSKFHPADLGAINLQELLIRLPFDYKKEIAEVIIGHVANLPDTANIARVIALKAGLPQSISAATVHRNCASSLESLNVGVAKIKSGMYDTMIAGGVETMSMLPLLWKQTLTDKFSKLMRAKTVSQKLKILTSVRLGELTPRIGLLEALQDPFTGISMGQTAEILSRDFGISRTEQDEFAINSHNKACKNEQKLQEEMFPIFAGKKYQTISKDMGVRQGLTLDRLGKMRPYFDKKYGTVTVANSCPINDGSSMLVLMSQQRAQDLGLKVLAKVRSIAFAGLEPQRMGLGPVYATPIALKKAGLSLKDIDLIELNEAFSAQVLACLKAFASDKFCKKHLGLQQALGEIDPAILNVNGGAIALGHPVSATGTRMALTLAKEMKRRNVQFGLATLCIGGGQGGALILENV